MCLNARLIVQVGHSTRDAQDAMSDAGGTVQALHGLDEQVLARRVELAMGVDGLALQLGVGAALTLLLALSAAGNAISDRLRRLTPRQG